MKNLEKEILYIKANQLNDSDLFMDGLRNFWPKKEDKDIFRKKQVVTEDIAKLTKLALQDGDYVALKRAVFYIDDANKYYDLEMDYQKLLKAFSNKVIFRQMYSYLCSSYLEFLDKKVVSSTDVMTMFENLNVNIEDSPQFPYIFEYLGKFAECKNSNFEKIENEILKKLHQAKKIYIANKNDEDIKERYQDSLDYTFRYFIKENSDKVNLPKFKSIFTNEKYYQHQLGF